MQSDNRSICPDSLHFPFSIRRYNAAVSADAKIKSLLITFKSILAKELIRMAMVSVISKSSPNVNIRILDCIKGICVSFNSLLYLSRNWLIIFINLNVDQ